MPTTYPSTLTNDSVTLKLMDRWKQSQVSMNRTIKKIYGGRESVNSDGLSRLVIEGYTRATLDAMSKAMISIQDTGHPTGLMTAADDLECFYKNLQVLRLGVDGMEDRPIGQGSQIGSDTQTRREVLNSAIATNLDTFAREATDICLEAYSHRDGPKIARKRDTRTTTDWESFIQLTTILKGPALPKARPSELRMVMYGRTEEEKRDLIAGATKAALATERTATDPLTVAESMFFEPVLETGGMEPVEDGQLGQG